MNSLEQPMSAMSVNTIKMLTPEIDWASKSLSHNSRIYSKIAVINGVNTGALTTSTQGAFSFQIPAKVLSLKDSYVSMDLSIATAGGAGNASVISGNLGNLFSRIVCTADNNAVLFDINDFHRFGSMLHAPSMTMETLNQECISGTHLLLEADADTSKRSPFNVLQKNCRGIFTDAATTQVPLANKPPCDFFTNGTTAFHQENVNENSYRHYIQQTAVNATTTNYSIQFRLKDLLPHTICALEQLLYFGGSQLQFDFYINNIDFVGYKATNTTLTTSGVNSALPATTFANFQFTLCVESNVNTIDTIVNKVKSEGGLTIPIPYVYGSKTTISSSTSHNVNQVITRSAGEKLMWVAYAPFTSETTRDIINSHSIITASAVTGQPVFTIPFSSYNTSLDNIFIKSQSTIECTKGEHYLYNKNELKGSALQGLEALTNDFVHIDSWIGKPLCQYDPSVEDGLHLKENHTWGINATTASLTIQHYVYYCVQRKLVIGNFSVQVI
jgi:hypothetical protein